MSYRATTANEICFVSKRRAGNLFVKNVFCKSLFENLLRGFGDVNTCAASLKSFVF